MSDITPETFPKYTPHPLLASLPPHLKDPKNYEKIQRLLLDAGATKHSHGEMVDWAGCNACQRKAWERKETMRKLGFESGTQYMMWKKVHETIKERFPLAKYNDKK